MCLCKPAWHNPTRRDAKLGPLKQSSSNRATALSSAQLLTYTTFYHTWRLRAISNGTTLHDSTIVLISQHCSRPQQHAQCEVTR